MAENRLVKRHRSNVVILRAAATAIGVAAGGVGFAGFFVNFFNGPTSALSSASSAWFDLIPVFIGLSLFALAVPRYGYLASGLALISFGLVFGVRGIITEVSARTGALTGRVTYGAGFWMIVVGAGVLSVMWLVILTTMRTVRNDHALEDLDEDTQDQQTATGDDVETDESGTLGTGVIQTDL